MGHVLVGCCGFGSERKRIQGQLSAMELQDSFLNPPRVATLTRWRDEVRDASFTFTLRGWQLVTHPPESPTYSRLSPELRSRVGDAGLFRPTAIVQEAYERSLQACEALGAAALVFETPPSFTPTTENRRRLRTFFQHAPRLPDTLVAWDARGLWELADVEALCLELDLLACCDPLALGRYPRGDRAYFKVRATAPRPDDLEALAEAALEYQRCICMFHTPDMLRDARRLQQLLADG